MKNLTNPDSPKSDLAVQDGDRRQEFLLAEFGALRREIEAHIAERRKILAQTFIGLAAIYSWVLSRNPPLEDFYMKVILTVPVFFAATGTVRWIAVMMRAMALGMYIQTVEKQLVEEGHGWENFLSKLRFDKPFRGRLEGFSEAIILVVILMASSVFSIYLIINT